jgi:hypothetical protein
VAHGVPDRARQTLNAALRTVSISDWQSGRRGTRLKLIRPFPEIYEVIHALMDSSGVSSRVDEPRVAEIAYAAASE